jgi:peptide/nickel transport system substrate-binding protein
VEAREIDIAWGLSTSLIPQLRELEDEGIDMVTVFGARYDIYTMNPDRPMFQDSRTRLAIHHAIDRQFLIDEQIFGEGVITNSAWGGSPWENTGLVSYEFDPEQSRQLLEEAGWKDEDGDGIREAHGVEGVEDGTPFTFLHLTWCGADQQADSQLYIQQMLKGIGIDMQVDCRRSAELFGTWSQGGIWSHGEFDMGGWVHGLRVPDPEISNRYLCSEIASEENPSGSQWHRYCNPKVDELLLAQAQEFDSEKRTELLFEAQEYMHEDAYMIYLFRSPRVYTVRSDLKNVVIHSFANLYWNPQEWEWE